MTTTLRDIYQSYLCCLNRQAWNELGKFVCEDAEHNGRPFGLEGYRAMLIKDYQDIPDLHFNADTIVSEPPMIAARLTFNCSPKGEFLGLLLNGRTVSFAENVIYEFEGTKIRRVWSALDKQAIERQLAVSTGK
ncbi:MULTISPECIES: ester cyclase [Rhizobium]|nr:MULTISPECIES: ester cyclase [Rhizobium]MCS0462178.1 ester cyclase [Rhizobium favelukesii]UFS80886.1 ester cyclase [Rhizobium sp. T136]